MIVFGRQYFYIGYTHYYVQLQKLGLCRAILPIVC